MTRVLYVRSRRTTFTDIDQAAIGERFEVIDHLQPGRRPRPLELIRKLRRTDVVFGWHATSHTLLALVLARAMGKPSVLVIGGVDTARMPEIGYGAQRLGPRRWIARGAMAAATRLITNSRHSLREIAANVGLPPGRVTLLYHGIPDRFADRGADGEAERMALTVGVVYEQNLERKGQRAFVEASGRLPEIEFVLVGRWHDGAITRLRDVAGPNVAFTGYLDDDELDSYFRRAVVYVQPSLHEGFGLAVAEAMLARCVPVVSDAGALREVVGDTGVVIPRRGARDVADGVRRALEMGPDAGERARRRVLEKFSYEMRREGLWSELEAALRGERTSATPHP